MPSMPAGYNKKDNEQSITHSAVSQGTIIIRNENEQKQDINELSRDTEHASNELKHIFDKEKEQSKIDQTRLVSEISGETLTMLNTIDRIKATEEAKKAVEDKRQKSDKPLTDKEQQEIYKEAYDKAMNEGMSAMGSNTRQGIDMAINIINGLITGDMTGAIAGALAPKLATIIKQQTGDNKVANTISHSILGAVVAELQGNSAVVGGVGAAVSERGAEVIASILYPNKSIDELNQDEKQQVSALAQLATGLTIAALGGDAQDINTAIAGGKNAVENNRLLTPKEEKRLWELAKDDLQQYLLYKAAACALVHCSKEFADDDPRKAEYLALEELGNSSELDAYREELSKQTDSAKVKLPNYTTGGGEEYYRKLEKLFEYTTGDSISDNVNYFDSKYSISIRAGGVLQLGYAALDGVAAVALSPACGSVAGCAPSVLLTWSMVDNGATALMVIYKGKTYYTQTAQGLSKILGTSESDAEMLFGLSTGAISANSLKALALTSRTTGQKLTEKEIEQINKNVSNINKEKEVTNAGNGTKLEIDPNKFDYLYGKVNSGSHNTARSTQLSQMMRRLGLQTN
ncbi:VENN motif pre-toxin domain-containing protein, partial [Gilliamella sp. wkB171]|uniref:VENN motif pre-toxin domain-containing protein n=1 Tax=Gilliamella sp. wkB171 TaxID=3120258 RepID=UPI003FA5DF20